MTTPRHIALPNIRAVNGRLTCSRRWHPDQHDTHTALERELAAAKVLNYAAEVMANAPALHTEDVAAVAAILTGKAVAA